MKYEIQVLNFLENMNKFFSWPFVVVVFLSLKWRTVMLLMPTLFIQPVIFGKYFFFVAFLCSGNL